MDYLDKDGNCPQCGGEVKELIAYVRCNKTCDGYKCKECEWEKTW